MADDHEDDQLDVTLDSDRLCGYSGCRAPLPVSTGPGNRARYCQDGKTWGGKQLTCKQAGHAEELVSSLGTPATPPPMAVTALTERIDGLIHPTRELVAALEQTREQLTEEAAAARAQRDEALRTAAQERGLRELAEERAEQAERQAATHAEQARSAAAERDDAVTGSEQADTAREQAERARLRAEARAEELAEQWRRTDERLQAATGHAEERDRAVAAAQTTITELRARSEEEQRRVEAERTRADRSIAQLQRQLEEVRSSAETRTSELQREHEQERAALAEKYDATIAELHEQLGRKNQQLADERERAERLRERHDRWRAELSALSGLATESVDHPGDGNSPTAPSNDDQNSADLINRIQALLGDDSR